MSVLSFDNLYLYVRILKKQTHFINQKSKIMKIKFGAIVVDGRGKLGGHVFSKNNGGAYMRTKVTPTNPQTVDQTAVRALFAAITSGWSALTTGQITAWNEAVPEWTNTNIFGDLKKPTGKALYQRLNNQAQVVGLAAVLDVPAKAALPDNPITAINIDVSDGTLILTGASVLASVQVSLWAAVPVSDGTSNVTSKLRQIYTVAGNTFNDQDAFTAYEAKFGTIAVGQNIFAAVKYVISSGQASPLQILKSTVVA